MGLDSLRAEPWAADALLGLRTGDEIREIDGNRLRVGPLEAIDGTPVVDIKPVLK